MPAPLQPLLPALTLPAGRTPLWLPQGIEEMSKEDKMDAAQYQHSDEEEGGDLGLLGLHGEQGFGTLERR